METDSQPKLTLVEVTPTVSSPKTKDEYSKQLHGAKTLAELAEDFRFFTTGIFAYCGLKHDPVQDFINESSDPPLVATLPMQRAIFHGLKTVDGDDSWNYKLMVVEDSRWDELFSFLSGVAVSNMAENKMLVTIPHSIFIPDPWYCYNRTVVDTDDIPLIPVTVFGMRNKKKQCVLKSPKNIYFGLPMVAITNTVEDDGSIDSMSQIVREGQ